MLCSLCARLAVQAELVEPAVRGTRAVMTAAAANKADVRRIVLTSSCAGERWQWWKFLAT